MPHALEEPGNPNPSKWFTIATHVPGRSNKDCRKRWFARMAVDIVRGVWSAEEDAKLMNAVTKHGTKWSLVATMVHSRNSDQCAKRWTDTLDPSIDRSGWTPELDRILCNAVNEHGTCWKKIVRTYFPGRTGLSAKNRLVHLLFVF
ncbi:Homeodomain-like protein [Rhodocollybia butyracea]|uniref:Homeodomain-like protein n=1 Tax=Rhodocollybia butyracea TaxID=206335 RepID=A0A9P5PBU7_9AGAR|nr:Homeodomain-like protein [Rhodocollybia butyracea]